MPFTTICPLCGDKFTTPDNASGRDGRCLSCQAPDTIVGTSSLPVASLFTLKSNIWWLRTRRLTVNIRQAARQTFDLSPIGSGTLERLCSALALGAFFFMGILLGSRLARLDTRDGLLLAVACLAVVVVTSGVLVLWSSDETLEKTASCLQLDLAAQQVLLRQAVEAARARQATEDEREPEEAEKQATVPQPEIPQSLPLPMQEERSKYRDCPYCAEEILSAAVKCKHCGEFLDGKAGLAKQRETGQPLTVRSNPGVAAVLSLFIPGLGQMYKGEVIGGFAWMFAVAVGYIACVFPGIILHLICIFVAASGSE